MGQLRLNSDVRSSNSAGFGILYIQFFASSLQPIGWPAAVGEDGAAAAAPASRCTGRPRSVSQRLTVRSARPPRKAAISFQESRRFPASGSRLADIFN